jgi:hypothetical protein
MTPMTECQNLPNCGFMKKFNESKNLACKGFIVLYCRGEQQGNCKRKQYKATHGAPPADEMMPNGQMVLA